MNTGLRIETVVANPRFVNGLLFNAEKTLAAGDRFDQDAGTS
jgi:hypothetical protein